jgi:hypothetical protein
MAKFNEKAIAIYGVAQVAEGVSAININPTGLITTTVASAAVTGTGTLFLTEVAIGSYLFTSTGAIIGRVLSIASNTALTLESIVPAGATAQSSGVMALATAIIGANRAITGTITTVAGSTAVTGTNFVVDALAAGDTLYVAGIFVGVIASVTGATALVLRDSAISTNTTAIYTAKQNAFTTGLGPKNALAVSSLNYSTELTSNEYQYTGDELDRDADTTITDKFAKFDFEVRMPSLGAIAGGDPVLAEIPMADWFQSIGMAVVLSTGSTGYVKYTNAVVSNTFMTIEVRLSSPDLATTFLQKSFVTSDCRGSADFDGTIGNKGKLKFNYMGNLKAIADKMTLVPNFFDQKTSIADNLNSKFITLSELTLWTSQVEPTIIGTSNLCFTKLIAPNLEGFSYTRVQTSCLDAWDKQATPTDVTLTIQEDKASATYNPDNHLEGIHKFTLRYGNVVGNKVEITQHKLQLAKVTASKVGVSRGQDLGFRNIGTTEFKLS